MTGLVFKIVTDQYVGRLAYIRIYSGKATSSMAVTNTTRDKNERLGRLLRMHANQREDIDEVYAGDIVGAVGLKNTFTGDTLSEPSRPLLLEAIKFPEPVISVAIEPKSKADSDKMGEALQKLAEEDPTFQIRFDEETGQTLISGMGELHLEVIVDRMLREFGVNANVGRPQVAYREALTRKVRVEGRLRAPDRWSRPVRCRRRWRSSRWSAAAGFVFENKTVGGSVPREYVNPTEQGVKDAMESGPVGGYPVVDVKVALVDGSVHPVDSSEMAFRMAGIEGMRKAMANADAGAAGADHEGRGAGAGAVLRRRAGRHQLPPRPRPRRRDLRHAADYSLQPAAGRDFRLHDGAAVYDPGPREPHDGVRPVRSRCRAHVAEKLGARSKVRR